MERTTQLYKLLYIRGCPLIMSSTWGGGERGGQGRGVGGVGGLGGLWGWGGVAGGAGVWYRQKVTMHDKG